MKSKIIGYTTGVYDLFHIGHLNILKRARENCDYLIVAVSTDEMVIKYKNKKPIISFEERIEIVKAIRYVDEVIPQYHRDKVEDWRKLSFNKIFVGDDWKNTQDWINWEQEFKKVNVEVTYFPYTKHTSSTKLSKILDEILGSKDRALI